MTVNVQYFAVFKEQAGKSKETLQTECATARALYTELAGLYGFALSTDLVRVAINGEFCELDHPIADGQTVVFIPPVAGG